MGDWPVLPAGPAASPLPPESAADSHQLFEGYNESLLVFAAVCCGLFAVVGVPGNLVTIVALLRCRKVRNATAVFIVNLSVSDLLLGCVNLPLAAHTFAVRRWPHGDFLCKLFPLLRYALVAVSLLSVLAITLNRYVLIAHPRKYPRVYTARNLALMVAATWVFPFGALAPTWLGRWGEFGLDAKIGSCSILPDASGSSPKEFLFVAAFLTPAAAIALCYARIFCIVRRSAVRASRPGPAASLPLPAAVGGAGDAPKPASDGGASAGANNNNINVSSGGGGGGSGSGRMTPKDRRLLKMILVIFASFLVCYLPITLYKTFHKHLTEQHALNIAGYLLIYLSTCINPFIYVVMSSEYRRAYTDLLLCRPRAGGAASAPAAAPAAATSGRARSQHA